MSFSEQKDGIRRPGPEKQKDGIWQLRRLRPEEHDQTRHLYETVFAEDGPVFTDYYYRTRARENEIYAALEDGQIRSMIHVNPVKASCCGSIRTIPYLVAVATQEEYRHRGLMVALLKLVLDDLTDAAVPFVFLMPANEAIYTPFGFRSFWPWRTEEEALKGTLSADGTTNLIALRECTDDLLGQLSERVNGVLAQRFSIFTVRDTGYYRRLEEELTASGNQGWVVCDSQGPCYLKNNVTESFPPMMARVLDRKAFLRMALEKTDGQDFTPADEVPLEQLPESLGKRNPFLHCMICEEV